MINIIADIINNIINKIAIEKKLVI